MLDPALLDPGKIRAMEALLDPGDTTSGLLAAVRTSRAVAEQADRDVLVAAARFAALHSVDTVGDAARLDGDVFGDRMLPLASRHDRHQQRRRTAAHPRRITLTWGSDLTRWPA